MATYLLTWNPERWRWDDLDKCISQLEAKGTYPGRWSCGSTKKINSGDRVFLMKLGRERLRGLIASGYARSNVFEDRHWDKSRSDLGVTALYIDITYDELLNPTDAFPLERLNHNYKKMNWTPQGSGITIPDEITVQLERDWKQHCKQCDNHPTDWLSLPEEVPENRRCLAGSVRHITVNIYERNPIAREACVQKYGATCVVCGFSFQKQYGPIGSGYIHVHHLKPISKVPAGYKLNPVRDLRPVCPNCHAMLHRHDPPYSISELIAFMKQAQREHC
jgi:5-methylcytosine-specific restriction protein A